MKFGMQSLSKTLGAITAHQVQDTNGQKLLDKGQVISEADIETLQAAKIDSLVVVTFEVGDIEENEAAQRIASALAGESVVVSSAEIGRVNLLAEKAGVLHLDPSLLERFNSVDEAITIASLPQYSLVQAEQIVASVKIIPYAINEVHLQTLETLARANPSLMSIRPLKACSVALLITGRSAQREALINDYESAVRQRLENLGSRLDTIAFCAHEENEIAATLKQFQAVGFDLVLIAGIAATIDRNDTVPTALRMAGGSISQMGLPIDPGSLLALGYLGQTPLIAASTALKSPQRNAIDLLLPRLLSGEALSRADLAAMGHGGLLNSE